MRNTFAKVITELAGQNEKLVLLSGDIGNRLFVAPEALQVEPVAVDRRCATRTLDALSHAALFGIGEFHPPDLGAVLLRPRPEDLVLLVDLADSVEYAVDDCGCAVAAADARDLPSQRRAALRPLFEQARLRGRAVPIWPLPLWPIELAGGGDTRGTNKGGGQGTR